MVALQYSPRHPVNSYRLAIGALGIVFGDIGTSPLYIIKTCFYGTHAINVRWFVHKVVSLFAYKELFSMCY